MGITLPPAFDLFQKEEKCSQDSSKSSLSIKRLVSPFKQDLLSKKIQVLTKEEFPKSEEIPPFMLIPYKARTIIIIQGPG